MDSDPIDRWEAEVGQNILACCSGGADGVRVRGNGRNGHYVGHMDLVASIWCESRCIRLEREEVDGSSCVRGDQVVRVWYGER